MASRSTPASSTFSSITASTELRCSRGVAGFGSTHRIHSAHILEISDHLPIKIEFIETREKVDALLPELEKRTNCGIIEMQETTVVIPCKK
jgi:uncharacterized protein